VAKRSTGSTKIRTLNQIRHLGFTATDDLRERFRGVSRFTSARLSGPSEGTFPGN
jgi:phenylacetate-coenzyme A ligase PaaK-like adenylate-forming protein